MDSGQKWYLSLQTQSQKSRCDFSMLLSSFALLNEECSKRCSYKMVEHQLDPRSRAPSPTFPFADSQWTGNTRGKYLLCSATGMLQLICYHIKTYCILVDRGTIPRNSLNQTSTRALNSQSRVAGFMQWLHSIILFPNWW